MDRNSFIWVLESCLLHLDGTTKQELLEYGCPGELADMGIRICEMLKSKEINVYQV